MSDRDDLMGSQDFEADRNDDNSDELSDAYRDEMEVRRHGLDPDTDKPDEDEEGFVGVDGDVNQRELDRREELETEE